MSPFPEPPEADAPRVGRSRRGAETAQRILDAAEALFAERGFAGTTLRDVADRVDLRIPSLYNHFDSKESLYQAVLERGVAPVMQALSAAIEAGPDNLQSPDELIEGTMAVLVARPVLARLILHETLSGGQHLTPALRGIMQPVFRQAQQLLDSTLQRGQTWSAEEGRLLVLAIYHVMLGFVVTAPLYRELMGIDLMADDGAARQAQLVSRMTQILFADPKADAPG